MLPLSQTLEHTGVKNTLPVMRIFSPGCLLHLGRIVNTHTHPSRISPAVSNVSFCNIPDFIMLHFNYLSDFHHFKIKSTKIRLNTIYVDHNEGRIGTLWSPVLCSLGTRGHSLVITLQKLYMRLVSIYCFLFQHGGFLQGKKFVILIFQFHWY